MTRRWPLTICVSLLLACLLPGVAIHAASPGVKISDQVTSYPENEQGLTMLGSRYLYVGTSTANTLYVLDFRARHAVRWRLPDLGNGIAYGMEHLVLSPDNRWLYISSYVRGDVVALDVTGRQGMRTIAYGQMPTALSVSRDGRYLYVGGGYLGFSSVGATHVYETATGTQVGRGFAADYVASGPGGVLYGVSIQRGHAAVYAYKEDGSSGRLLVALTGNVLAAANGSIAVSPDGRRLYVLWDGLRALDARTGRVLGLVRLPIAPTYTGLVVAPNGAQAMLWAPNIAGWSESPTSNPAYVRVHYGFAAGGVLPVDLTHMRPLVADLAAIVTPRAVAYAADSRHAYVTELKVLDWLTTGTAGHDAVSLPPVSLAQPIAGASGGAGGTSGGSGAVPTATAVPGATPAATCRSWDVSGTWRFESMTMGNGQAALQQSGTTVSGTVTQNGSVGWRMSGSIQGAMLSLSFSAPGYATTAFKGPVSTDGSTIDGGSALLSGGHARCLSS